MSRLAVFDLDGTLVDSVPDLRSALNRLAVARGLAPFSAAQTQAMVGDGARALVERSFAARQAVMTEADYQDFLADYIENAAVETRPYPGVADTLRTLRELGWTLAVCTNKPETPARALLESLGLLGLFKVIGGGDSYAVRKPDPGHLLAVIAACDGQPGRTVMVGDHHNDIAAASGAGVFVIWAGWGYGADGTGASAQACEFTDLPALMDRF